MGGALEGTATSVWRMKVEVELLFDGVLILSLENNEVLSEMSFALPSVEQDDAVAVSMVQTLLPIT
jgi:hypothetical protein